MQNTARAIPDDGRRKQITSGGVSKGYKEKYAVGPMDFPFFLVVMILLVMGIIMMFSAGYAWAIAKGNKGTNYVSHQLIMAVIGLVGMFFMSFFDYHWLRKPIIAYGFYSFCVVLLILCRVGPFQYTRGYSHRWIQIGPLRVPAVGTYEAGDNTAFLISYFGKLHKNETVQIRCCAVYDVSGSGSAADDVAAPPFGYDNHLRHRHYNDVCGRNKIQSSAFSRSCRSGTSCTGTVRTGKSRKVLIL